MAMWNETDLDITFEDYIDHSAVIRECFGVASLEDDADGSLYYKSFSGNGGKYNIQYHERGYFDHGYFVEKIEKLARQLPHHPFTLSAAVWNEGSGGNYHDEFIAKYEYGTLEYEYYCDYEMEDKFSEPPLIKSDSIQLFPRSDFIEDIEEAERKRALIKAEKEQKDHLIKTGKLKDAAGKIFVSTGLTPAEEATVKDIVERSGGVFKPKFVKGISCLVYNPEYGRETTKMRDAKALKAEGKDVKIITFEEFWKSLRSGSPAKSGSLAKQPEEKPKKRDTKTIKYDSIMSFELPKGYDYVKEKDEDGVNRIAIKAKPIKDEDGEDKLLFICGINDLSVDFEGENKGKKLTGRKLLDATTTKAGLQYFYLPGEPAAVMLCKIAEIDKDKLSEQDAVGLLTSFLIVIGRPFALALRVAVDKNRLMEFICMGSASDPNNASYKAMFKGMMDVASSIRVNNEPLHLGKLTHNILENAFAPSYITSDTSADLSTKLSKYLSDNNSTAPTSSSSPSSSEKKTGRKFYEVEGDRLVKYKGNAYDKMSLTIPKDVAVIGSGAIVDDEEVRFITIPKSVTLIEAGAFQNLPKLMSVIVPDTDIKIDKDAFINCPEYRFDTFSGSPTESYCKRNGIPCKTDNLCKAFFPEIVRKREKAEAKAKAKAEAEAKAKAEAEQKRIEEEHRLKRIAAALQQKLTTLYHDRLDQSQYKSLESAVAAAIADTCDRKTWCEIRKRKIPAIPMANLSETNKKLESVAPEEAYDLLPEWIAEEYIHTAEEKRIQHLRAEEEKKARLAFETIIRELNGIANESVLPLFENGIEKNEILEQFASRAKTVVGDGAIINSGLAKYIGNATLETLKFSLGRKPFDSAESLVDAVIEKKSSEIDRLTSLLEKKNSDLETIEKEKVSLEEERAHLGLFHGKRKKEIAALLEQIPVRIKYAEEEYEKAKKQV